jgi:hypothetical protein
MVQHSRAGSRRRGRVEWARLVLANHSRSRVVPVWPGSGTSIMALWTSAGTSGMLLGLRFQLRLVLFDKGANLFRHGQELRPLFFI